jgi:hypothetical protein
MPDSPILVYIVDEGGLVTLNIVLEGDLTRIALSPSNVAQLASDLSSSTASYLRRQDAEPVTSRPKLNLRSTRRQLDS